MNHFIVEVPYLLVLLLILIITLQYFPFTIFSSCKTGKPFFFFVLLHHPLLQSGKAFFLFFFSGAVSVCNYTTIYLFLCRVASIEIFLLLLIGINSRRPPPVPPLLEKNNNKQTRRGSHFSSTQDE